MKLTPSEWAMALMCGRTWHSDFRPRTPLAERIQSARHRLVLMTRQDFGYDLLAWFDFLWDTDCYGYRGARRSREKALRPIQRAVHDPAWQAAVRELELLESPDEQNRDAQGERESEGVT
ncbi:MAG: hypothetical protein IT428_14920 [Planctomycetaceae bacterium]|nr:hypothetical protein [Planctomycetaceae bacterium]